MTPEAQRIAIAGACGWRLSPPDSTGILWAHGPKTPKGTSEPLPDYLNDLNAMHEAEKVLDERQQDTFAGFLGSLTAGRQIDFGATRINATTRILFATAAQRAEAFLRTIGKWSEPDPQPS